MNAPALYNEPSSDSLLALETEIATLSATIQAATYRLLCLIEEFDRRSGWSDPLDSNGFRSCAHWLSWRVGFDLGAARQYVRVARALPDLPLISGAFALGEVSYSKVRAITRIATPENEEMLLDWAKAGTASHVEKLVRQYRRADRPLENARAMAQQDSRRLLTFFDQDGMLVVRGRLTPEQGAMFVKALEACREDLLVKDGSAETSAEASAEALAEASAEISATSGGSDTDLVSPKTSPAHEPAAEVDGGQLMADALARMAERALSASALEVSSPSADRFQVVVHVDAEVLANPEADGRCELEDGPAVAADTARRLACDATVSRVQHGPEGELGAGRKTRVISAPLRRALKARDGSRCAFPGCGCRGRDAHHVQPWAEGGPTVLSNILLLCKRHHMLVHEGGYRVDALPGGGFRFFGPDGKEVLAAPPMRSVPGCPKAALAARWVPPEATITAESLLPTWMGERVDYAWAVESLWARTHRADPREISGQGNWNQGTGTRAPEPGNGVGSTGPANRRGAHRW